MKPPIVFFDCDGVLITDPLWPKLHQAVGLPDELDRKWWNEYYSGKISNDQWIKNVAGFYRRKKLSKKIFTKVLSDIRYNPEAIEIINFLKSQKIMTAIISSGIDFYIKKAGEVFNVDFWRANATFHFDKNGLFTNWDFLTDDAETKVIQIKEICEELDINPTDTLFVGDTDNDLKAFELTRHGILYKGKNPAHKKIAWKLIDNLMEIKDLVENNS